MPLTDKSTNVTDIFAEILLFIMVLVFWICLAVILYTYIGYPIFLFILVQLKRALRSSQTLFHSYEDLPNVTLLVACYNESDILAQKIENTLQLHYPVDKLSLYFVTDGSTDNSAEIISKHPRIKLFHENERKGKNAAINRVMTFVHSPIVVLTDANTFLNKDAIQLLARHYKDAKVGAVTGEKRVMKTEQENAAGGGEGAYWKYESKLKKWDSELNTVVGAAGELFSIRKELYEPVPKHVLIEDFRLSMRIAEQGYKVVYEPEAYAVETSSLTMRDEEKRKVRITAGGLIEVMHFMHLLKFWRYGVLTFQYVSHRMLRWTLAPVCLLIIFFVNAYLASTNSLFFQIAFACQLAFYGMAIVGYWLREKASGVIIVPYYFAFMNLSVFKGAWNLLRKRQSVVWDKAQRKSVA